MISGTARVLGDGVDTDVLAPGSAADFYGLSSEAEAALLVERAFRAGPPGFKARIGEGDILVAGRNFGCGSHRERANRVLPLLGFRAIVADSVARIFFRNSISLGIPCFEAPGVSDIADDGRPLVIDTKKWEVRADRGAVRAVAYSPRVEAILAAGGMIGYIRQRMEQENV